jgi:ABC-2 type transport system permease protein
MNWRAVRAVVRKDLMVVRRSKPMMVPLVIVPLILLVIVPVVLIALPAVISRGAESAAEMQRMLAELPPVLRVGLTGHTPEQMWVVIVSAHLLAPLFLMVPFMVASVIAADSFAGERERKTLEALLYTPTTDRELMVAKTLASWVPAVVVAVLGFVLYALVANLAAWPIMGRVFFPNLAWLVLVFWLAPGCAAFGLAGVLLVSLRVGTTQEAVQLSGLLVLPIIALLVGQIRGVVLIGPVPLVVVGAVMWLVALGLLAYGVGSFRRTKLIARL